ncbi:hypothetical protein Tco_0358827, partial [Tanacetum coccineum]
DLDYLLTGDKERRIALSISKLKAAHYLDFGLEELVPSLWVEEEGILYQQTQNRVGDLQLEIESYQTKVNLERPNWDAADYYFKEDYTIVPKPRAVVYRDRNNQRKLMRLNELHKAWRLGSGQRMTREEAKTSSQQLRKDYRSEGSIEDTYPILLSFTHCGNKSILRVLRIILVILPEHPSETIVFHNEDGNPARANIKQALGSFKDGDRYTSVQASANSDVMYFFTSAQDGDPSQDDVRL